MDHTKVKTRQMETRQKARIGGTVRPVGAVLVAAAAPIINFPRCNAAVQKMKDGGWELADAIVEECSETGEDGVRNKSMPK